MTLSPRTAIQLLLLALCGAALLYASLGGTRLRALFRDDLAITGALALEDIRGARAGEVVSPRKEPELVRHTVEKGDTWWQIAKRYNVYDYNELERYHDFKPLRPGMVIEIPPELMEGSQ